MHKILKFRIENGNDRIETINKPTPISEQLMTIKSLSGRVFGVFRNSLCSSIPFESTVINAVDM